MARVFGVVLVGVLLAGPCWAFPWDDCQHDAPREAVVDAAGATVLRIEAGAGFLHVEGKEGLTEVRASGTACAKKKAQLEEVELVGKRSGTQVVIQTRMPSSGTARLDLSIAVPSGMRVELEDSSGELKLAKVAGAQIEDSSGEIEVSDIAGDLLVEDSSGEIEIRRVTGAVQVNDSSGEIEIVRITGDVLIEEDSSGDITVKDVGGSLHIRRDGSGDIRAERIDGDFVVDRDGSGDIDYEQIGGEVDIPK